MWLTALVNALPALANVAKDVINHDDKTAKAADVIADPHAPAAVKDAAAKMGTKAIDDSAAAQKAALQAAAGKEPAAQGASSTAMLVGLGIVLLVMGKKRR